MTDDALFQPRNQSGFLPTAAAVGPWDPSIVHGAAVAALFAGQLAPTDSTLARLTIEILAPVPFTLLHLERSELAGGTRVRRQDATLNADGRTVATARAVVVRQSTIDLPDKALAQDSPFDPEAVPTLGEPNRAARDRVGWESFDSRSIIVEQMKISGDHRTHMWINLAVPVIQETEIRAVEVAAIAADYAQAAVGRQLPYASWSFRNAELTLHFARKPTGSWVGMRCESVVHTGGAGFNCADLFDVRGRMGRSAAALVVEHRA